MCNDYHHNPDATGQLLFHQMMKSVVRHKEKIADDSGCLNVLGYTENKSPLLFNLEYEQSGSHWLISQIHVFLLESFSKIPSDAQCT